MQFEAGNIYHIYNQGNNRQKIFFIRENYLFFLKKIRKYILPYADIMAWCLMPNHFHFMVVVKHTVLTVGVTSSDADGHPRTFNDSIGIMLRSYTRAVNKQQNRTGKLFREKTKAECVICQQGLAPNFIVNNGVTQNNKILPEQYYPQILFNYIHSNPVKAGLVKRETDWEFSSAYDYFGERNGTLANRKIAKEFVIW